jgi:hypothetical protein
MLMGDNKVMIPGKTTEVICGKTYNMTAWLALGFDPRTTVSELPTSAEIISMARDLLSIH